MALWFLFLSSFTSATILPGSSEILLSGMLLNGDFDKWQLLLFATAGNVLGSIVTFYMGFYIHHKEPLNITDNKRHLSVYRLIQRWGWISLLLSWLPVFGDIFCLLAGWLRLDPLRSFIAIFVGKLIRYSIVIYFVNFFV